MEVKFEDFEADAMAMTEHIYKSLSIPGFEAAAPAISQYIGGKKGYKKNKYKYDDRTVRLVEENWKFALDQWGYSIYKINARNSVFIGIAGMIIFC